MKGSVPELMISIAKLYDQKIAQMLIDMELYDHQEAMVKIIRYSSIALSNGFKYFSDSIDAPCLSFVTGKYYFV